jgi:hypothetical protein
MQEAEATEGPLIAMMALVSRAFFRALVAAQLLGAGVQTRHDRRRLERWLDEGLERLGTWCELCPENFANRYLLVRAEAARLRGRWHKADADYAAAVAHARAHKVTGVEALALELEARHRRARGQAAAAVRLRDAIDAYERWGAHAKAAALRRTLPT